MNGITLVVALAALAVDYQVETTADNQQQYTIQIEPEILKLVAGGEVIHSEVPFDAGQIQRLCIRIGTTKPKHTAAGEATFRQLQVSPSRWAAAKTTPVGADSPPTILWPAIANPKQTLGVSFGFQPDTEGKQAYYVQLDPRVLSTLAAGDEIYAPIDPSAGRLSRFIVSSGNKQLPQVAAPPAAAAPPTAPPAFGTVGRTTIDPLPVEGGQSQYPAAGGSFAPAAAPPLVPRGNEFSTLPPAEAPTAPGAFNPSRQFSPAAVPPVIDRPGGLAPPANGGFQAPQSNPYGAAGTFDTARGGFGNGAGTTIPSAGIPSAGQYPPAASPVRAPLELADSRGYSPAPAAGNYPTAGANAGYGNNGQGYNNSGYGNNGNYNHSNYPQQGSNFGTPQENRLATLPPAATLPSAPLANVNPAGSLTAPPAQQAKESWGIFVVVLFALFFSIGGNLYLAWTALEFHNRYRSAIDRLRSAARSS